MDNWLKNPVKTLPFAFLAHNLEEALSMAEWTKNNPIPGYPAVNSGQFFIAAGLFTALGFMVVFAKKKYQTEKQYALVTAGFAGMLWLNVFFPHLIAGVLFQQPVPGVVTAVLIILPITTLILSYYARMSVLRWKEIVVASVLGAITGIVLIAVFLKAGEIVFPNPVLG